MPMRKCWMIGTTHLVTPLLLPNQQKNGEYLVPRPQMPPRKKDKAISKKKKNCEEEDPVEVLETDSASPAMDSREVVVTKV